MRDPNELIHEVEEGNLDALDVFIQLKEKEKEIKAALNEIEDQAMVEAAKHGKTSEHNGYQVQLKDGSRKYDFKGCPSWVEAEKRKKEIEEQLKAALQARERNILIATEDGEDIELPRITYSKSSITITKKA